MMMAIMWMFCRWNKIKWIIGKLKTWFYKNKYQMLVENKLLSSVLVDVGEYETHKKKEEWKKNQHFVGRSV